MPRSTQRAPRSCTWCASHKIKCDKKIPCSTCSRRGAAATCVRETVLVRGIVTRATDKQPTYEELQAENRRLQHTAMQYQLSNGSNRNSNNQLEESYAIEFDESLDLDQLESVLFASVSPQNVRPIYRTVNCVELPSHQCSIAMLRLGHMWHSWVHFALDHDKFEAQHEHFWTSISNGKAIEDHDPLWLAIYFSFLTATLLTMDNDDMMTAGLLLDNQERLLRCWYGSALHFLRQGDFMGSPDVRTVQAVAILGMCFLNFGDIHLYKTMWSCAIRIAQTLGLHDLDKHGSSGLETIHASRLWWTFVIDEWLAPCAHPPCVSGHGFNVPLSYLDDEAPELWNSTQDQKPAIVDYHKALAQIAGVYHRFSEGIGRKQIPICDLVRSSDEGLAEIISTLPSHLQPDEVETDETRTRDNKWPWISWQKQSIKLVLLYHRLSINRHLQREWLAYPGSHSGHRAICLSAAKGIIGITSHWNQNTSRRRQWALSVHVFAAGTCLLIESKDSQTESSNTFSSDINHCMDYLRQIRPYNAIAERGIQIMERLLVKSGNTRDYAN